MTAPRTCPICNAGAARALPRYAKARLVQCPRCRLVYAAELPSAIELTEYYARYPPSAQLPPLTARRYRELLTQLARFRQTGRLLDVGCGDGHFLAAAREDGWEVYGSEYGEGPRSRARQRDIDVRPAPFPATTEELGSFDVITEIEVLEHLPEPRAEIDHVAELLRPGGCLYLTTPNFNSLTRRLAGPRWRAIEYPEHLSLFTPHTIDRLFAGAGFLKQWLRTTGLSPADIWAALAPPIDPGGNVGGPKSSEQRLRAGMATSPMLESSVRAVNVVLSACGAGDTIKAVYTRHSGRSR